MPQPIETTTRLVGPTGGELLLQILAAAVAAAEAHQEIDVVDTSSAKWDQLLGEIEDHLAYIHRLWMELERVPRQAERDVRRKLREMVRGLR